MKIKNLKKKLILGTAQFGNPYGFNSSGKKLPIKIIKNILKIAQKNQINHIDTAENYNFKLSLLRGRQWIVDTKISVNNKNFNLNKIKKNLFNLYKKSNIKINTVYFHNPECLFSAFGKKVYEYLISIKKTGKIKKIGISVYSPKIIKKILKIYKIDVVQLPYNIFDRRFVKILPFLKKNRISIYARSIFLQGALISNKENSFTKKIEFIKFNKVSKKLNIDRVGLCLNYVCSNHLIKKIIVGVDNSKQLISILNTKKKFNLNLNFLESNNKKIIDPRKWKKIN